MPISRPSRRCSPTSERERVDGIYHIGDLVGYAPWPDEVVALIRAREIAGVAGNYDSTVGLDYRHCGCRYEDPRQEALSHESFEWRPSPARERAI